MSRSASSPDRQIFMVGRGGQGILLLARALAEWAGRMGCDVITSETHGMAMRGGTVTASLKVGAYAGPLIPAGSADVLIGLDAEEAMTHLFMLRAGGVSIVNARDKGPFSHAVDAAQAALSLGAPGAVNMIMLGFAARLLGIDRAVVEDIVEKISPPGALAANRKALSAGYSIQET
ncbi:MAG TPA: 2-oxoacid:acceptor oxidoreductase family protein [Deltaproteobacteria bacterium]|nr:2-oxoacid:acceptor oxidoreductase family protein [Deltaproteobacteria bacterium]HPL87108.1 2-oxoacid:acceptor oxidoreductase family protein [Deltaproteobacteria bacterium]HRC99376.1 2-oxoacid:acceptor oxidoreductase family protein [Deltaproteobacteria bacterium]